MLTKSFVELDGDTVRGLVPVLWFRDPRWQGPKTSHHICHVRERAPPAEQADVESLLGAISSWASCSNVHACVHACVHAYHIRRPRNLSFLPIQVSRHCFIGTPVDDKDQGPQSLWASSLLCSPKVSVKIKWDVKLFLNTRWPMQYRNRSDLLSSSTKKKKKTGAQERQEYSSLRVLLLCCYYCCFLELGRKTASILAKNELVILPTVLFQSKKNVKTLSLDVDNLTPSQASWVSLSRLPNHSKEKNSLSYWVPACGYWASHGSPLSP